MNRAPFQIVLASALLLGACAPTRVHVTGSESFDHVREAYARRVAELNHSTDEDWYSGWMGNFWVNWNGGERRGLCYQWQAAIYPAVAAAAREVGWDAVGICLNEDRSSEHHAVIVFDPALIRAEELLEASPPRPAYVFDAWRRGEPDIFLLDDWLRRGVRVVRSMRLEDLDEELRQAREAEGASEGTAGASAEGLAADAPAESSRSGG